ncbi:MAG: tetratricopeptide repeat protein [Flavobacteriaceae bacterium]|nr:tetratricopeptide repeat protein [Flavobacteriaceae bacterium]
MKNSWLCFLFLFLITTSNAQTKQDSLYGIWQNKVQTDSTRVQALNSFIRAYLYTKPDSAIVLAENMRDFSIKKSYKPGIALGIHNIGTAHYSKGNYSEALKYWEESLKIKEEIGDKSGVSKSLNNIGIINAVQGNYLTAIEMYQKSIKIKEEIGAIELIPATLNAIGGIYRNQADYTSALNYFQRSLKISEDYNNEIEVITALNSIGLIYSDIGDQASAMTYYQRGLKIAEEIEYSWWIPTIIGNIGLVNERQGNYEDALNNYNKSLEISEDKSDYRGINLMLTNIGGIYKLQGKYNKALEYFQKSLVINEKNRDTRKLVVTLSNIGNLYLRQGNYIKAIAYCTRTLNLSKKMGYLSRKKDNCECLYFAHKELGNGNKALAYHEQMLIYDDSLQIEETSKKLQRMEFDKQILADSLLQVEKDLKVEMAHQAEVRKKEKNKDIALGAGIFFLLLSGGFYGRWRYVKKSKAIIEKEKDRSENLLLNILPSEIAEELKEKGSADARDFDMVSILFTDFKGFTQVAEKLSAKELIEEINHCFMAFDHICETYGIEKIKTIGDAYMAAGGLPVPSDNAVKNVVLAALDMQAFITNRIKEKKANNETSFQMRLGINTGPVVAGIVGIKKFQYDIWGDTVNTASRMESSGEIGKVNISENTYNLLNDDPDFSFESRGKIQAKGKGEIEMYFVTKVT